MATTCNHRAQGIMEAIKLHFQHLILIMIQFQEQDIMKICQLLEDKIAPMSMN
jgi:hypothetical protein